VILFANTITSRLRYIADFIGKELLGRPFILTTNEGDFRNYDGIRINYTSSPVLPLQECWIKPHPILFEEGILEQKLDITGAGKETIFFQAAGDMGFDIFGASFFLLSRYEEYLPHSKDSYGRYAHTNSAAFRYEFLQIPLINYWIKDFRRKLEGLFPGMKTGTKHFAFLPTYDIDETFSFRHKSGYRNLGGLARSVISGNFKEAVKRLQVWSGMKPDPFNSYAWMDAFHSKHALNPVYFFLVAEKTGRYDRHIPPNEKVIQELIRQHSLKYETGIHPSWQTGDDPALLNQEIKRLETITGKPVSASRQHFIRMQLPGTYRNLVSAGIRNDYSMGYGSINGFRASVASAFRWYDLEKEEISHLTIYPFCFMEANSFYEQKQSPTEALSELQFYIDVVAEIDGMLITIWHNTFLGTDAKFRGWRETYIEFVNRIIQRI
jgi:hypothetical protein